MFEEVKLPHDQTNTRDDALAFNDQGLALEATGDYAKAILCYNDAILLDPECLEAYNNKGGALEAIGEYEEALSCYNAAIDINPKHAQTYNNKGLALEAMNNYKEAIACYNTAIGFDPSYVQAYNNKGVALDAMEEYKRAIKCFEKAIELDRTYSRAYNNKALAEEAQGNYQQALDCYESAIRFSDPKNPLYYCNKGSVHDKLDQIEEALKNFKEANQLVQQNIWGDRLSDGNKTYIKQTLSEIMKLEREIEDAGERLSYLDPGHEDVKDAVKRFKATKVKLSRLASQKMPKLGLKKNIKTKEREETDNQIELLSKEVKMYREMVLDLTKRVTSLEQIMDVLLSMIGEIKEEMKTSGVLDKVKIKKGFKYLENNSPQLFAYAKTFYWTLLNYFTAYRNASTDVMPGNADSVTSRAEQVAANAVKFGVWVTAFLPLAQNLIGPLSEAADVIHEFIKEYRFEKRVNIVNLIVQNHVPEDEIHATIAFTALDVAFSLKTRDSFEFDEVKSESIWKKIKNKFDEKIEKIKTYVLGKSIPLYETSPEKAALRDVMLLLSYLYENHESVMKKKIESESFCEQFTVIILSQSFKIFEDIERDEKQEGPKITGKEILGVIEESKEQNNLQAAQKIEGKEGSKVENENQEQKNQKVQEEIAGQGRSGNQSNAKKKKKNFCSPGCSIC